MKLYTFPMSPNSVKVMAVIHQLGLDVELKVIDLTKGEHQTSDLGNLNPNKKIPTLQDGDFVIWESHAIMNYLAEKHNSPLIPEDLRQRAEMNQWMCWSLAHFNPAVGGIVWERVAPSFMPGYQMDQAALDKGLENLARFAPVLDAHLKDRKFVTGDEPSLADLSLAAPLIHAQMAQLPIQDYKNLGAWFERVSALSYFQQALPAQPSVA